MKRTYLLAAIVTAGAIACGSTSSSSDDAGTKPTGASVDPATGLRYADMGPVPPLPEWSDNPATPAKHALGATLFADVRLSGSGRVNCAACHFSLTSFQSGTTRDLPDCAFPDVAPVLPRHTPSLLNIVYAPMMRWDGSHFTDLYDMVAFPLAEANMNLAKSFPKEDVHGVDVAGTQKVLKQRLTVDFPSYVKIFADAFGEDIAAAPPETVWRLFGKAVAVYLRGAVSRDAPFDRYNAGDDSALEASALRGLALFRGDAGCIACHAGPLFSDFKFHNVSTSPPDAKGIRTDEGRYVVTGLEADRGAFLTPMLRGVAKTSPYLHDGIETSIAGVVRRKLGARGVSDPNHDSVLDSLPKEISENDVNDLVAFLKSLNGKEPSPADVAIPSTFPQ